MISVILLILTLLLIVVGGICGFRRGILKEGVRAVLWIVLFGCSLFFIPQLTDKVPLLVAERFGIVAVDVEQLVAELLKKVQFLRRETYLILPFAGFIRTLLVPFVVIVLFWAAGLASWLLYLIVSLFLRKKTEQQKLGSKIAGLVFGIVFALVSGAVTLYPVAGFSSALKEGDTNAVLTQKFAVLDTMSDSYEGTLVQLPYKFTGTEFLGNLLHKNIEKMVISKDMEGLWSELPNLIRLGSSGYGTYDLLFNGTGGTLEQQLGQTAEAYFSLNFISDENKLLLLNRLKTNFAVSSDGLAGQILNWIPLQAKEDFINDAAILGGVYDLLRAEGIVDALSGGAKMPILKEETGVALVNKLYGLSNAETVVPEFINLIYSTVLSEAEKDLVLTENVVLDEDRKEDISEVISVICKVSLVMEHAESMTLEEKKTLLDAIKELKDNQAVGNENYAALLKMIINKM